MYVRIVIVTCVLCEVLRESRHIANEIVYIHSSLLASAARLEYFFLNPLRALVR